MVDPTQPRRRAATRGGARRRRSARDVPVSGHAPLSRCTTSACRRSSRSPPRVQARRCSSTAACSRSASAGSSGWPSPFDIRFGNPLDLHAVALALSAGADHHSAFRRRPVSRSADGRGPVPEHPARHVELEWLDQISCRADARAASSARRSRWSAPIGCSSAPIRRSFRAAGWRDVYEQQSRGARRNRGRRRGAGEGLRRQLRSPVPGHASGAAARLVVRLR